MLTPNIENVLLSVTKVVTDAKPEIIPQNDVAAVNLWLFSYVYSGKLEGTVCASDSSNIVIVSEYRLIYIF